MKLLKSLDLSGTEVSDVGLRYIAQYLSQLSDLKLSKCWKVTDAGCAQLTTLETLTSLDLSGCKSLNWNGLECIWRLTRLKTLVLRDLEHIVDLKMLCLLILDVLPDLEIQGVDYLDTTLLEGSEHEHLIRDLFLSETKEKAEETTKTAEN